MTLGLSPLTLPSAPQAFPVLVGDMDNSGSLNAQVIHQLGPGLRSKMAIQVSGRMESATPPASLSPRLPLGVETKNSRHSTAKQTEPSESGAEKGLLQRLSKEYGWLVLYRPNSRIVFRA